MAGPIVISVVANAARANQSLNQTSGLASKIGSGFRKAAVPATAALTAIAAGAVKATQAAAADDAAQSKLAQTLKTAGAATKAQVAETEKWIAAQGKAVGVTDDELRPAISKLTVATGSIAKAQRLTALAMDVSAGSGKSLETVTTAIAKAQTGSLGGLSRLGVATKNVDGSTKSLSQVTKELASNYRGAASKSAETAAGKQKILQTQLGELQESIGAKLLPVLTRLSSVGLQAVAWIGRNQGVVTAFVAVVAALAVAVLAVNVAMALNPAVLVVAGLVALGAAMAVAYQRSETFRAVVQRVAGFVRGNVIPALAAFWTFLRTRIIPVVIQTAQRVAQNLRPVLTALANFIRGSVIPVVQKIAAKFREWWPTIQRIIVVVVKLYGNLLQFYAAVLGKVIPIVLRFAGFVLRTAVPAVIGFIGVIVRIIAKVIDFGRKVADGAKKVAQFVTGLKNKFGEAVTFVAGIPAKITGALGDLGGLLLDVGRQIIQGLIDGIEDAAGDLRDKLAEITDLIPDWKGPMSKDKRLLRPTGRAIMGGLVDGVTDGAAGVEKVLAKVTDLIEKTVKANVGDTKLAKSAIRNRIASLRDEYAALKANAKMQDRVTAFLEAARTKVTDLRKASADYASQVRDAVVSAASISSLGEGTGYGSVDQMLAILRGKVAESEAYTAMIARLRKAGLNSTTLEQLIGDGAEKGTGAASTLLAGGAAAIAEYNRLQARLKATGTTLGSSAADALYKAGISAADALVVQLERQAVRLDRVAERMATRLVRTALADLGDSRNAAAVLAGTRAQTTNNRYEIRVDVKPGGNPVDTGREIVRLISAYERAGGRR